MPRTTLGAVLSSCRRTPQRSAKPFVTARLCPRAGSSACPSCPATITGSTWPARPPLQVSLPRPSPAGWPAAAPSATLSLSRVGSCTGCTGGGQRSRHGRTKKRPRQLGGRRPAQAASWGGRCVDQHARRHSTRFSIRSSHPISGQQPVLCTDLCTRRHETGTNGGDPVRSQRRRQGVCAALIALRSRSATAETGVVVLITQRSQVQILPPHYPRYLSKVPSDHESGL